MYLSNDTVVNGHNGSLIPLKEFSVISTIIPSVTEDDDENQKLYNIGIIILIFWALLVIILLKDLWCPCFKCSKLSIGQLNEVQVM
jgi:hypothetical protein